MVLCSSLFHIVATITTTTTITTKQRHCNHNASTKQPPFFLTFAFYSISFSYAARYLFCADKVIVPILRFNYLMVMVDCSTKQMKWNWKRKNQQNWESHYKNTFVLELNNLVIQFSFLPAHRDAKVQNENCSIRMKRSHSTHDESNTNRICVRVEGRQQTQQKREREKKMIWKIKNDNWFFKPSDCYQFNSYL